MTARPPVAVAALVPAGHSPLRHPHSIRRTSSIDVTWPEGRDGRMHFEGRGRDIHTPPSGGDPAVLREDAFTAIIAPDRTIESIAALPDRPGIKALIGKGRRGDNLRRLIDELLPVEREAGSPLYLLLDDIPAAILISPWAWSRWLDDWMPKALLPEDAPPPENPRLASMEGICIGFSPGSSALKDLHANSQSCQAVVPLPHPDDPLGFHELWTHTQISMRRARRIDVWRDEFIHVNSTFQDSASVPEGGRVAVHEYVLNVTADPATMKLLAVEADPRILPYAECPAAVDNIGRLVGLPLNELRGVVLRELRRTLGCTHLNDALRALAEVPVLVGQLDRAAIKP